MVGIGFSNAAGEADIARLIDEALSKAGAGRSDVCAIAVAEFKRGAPVLATLAETAGAPLHYISDADLQSVQNRCVSFSKAAKKNTGLAAIAEAAALAAGGKNARLAFPRIKNSLATCALAILACETEETGP